MTDADEGALDGLSTADVAAVLAVLEGRPPGKLRDRAYAIGRLRRALARAGTTLGAAADAAGVGRRPTGPLTDAELSAELEASGAALLAELERQATIDWVAELARGAAGIEALLGPGPGPGGSRLPPGRRRR